MPNPTADAELDPGSAAYEQARAMLSRELRAIGAADTRNGFTAMADHLDMAQLFEIQTWVPLQVLARVILTRTSAQPPAQNITLPTPANRSSGPVVPEPHAGAEDGVRAREVLNQILVAQGNTAILQAFATEVRATAFAEGIEQAAQAAYSWWDGEPEEAEELREVIRALSTPTQEPSA